MNLTLSTPSQPLPALPSRLCLVASRGVATASFLIVSGAAFAQGTSPAGGIGAQLNLMSDEAINSGGTAASMAMYGAALITFIAGVWGIWKSRQPQSREGGYLGMGLAGLVLCGLFAGGGSWINKAAISTSGAAATANNTASVVKFQ